MKVARHRPPRLHRRRCWRRVLRDGGPRRRGPRHVLLSRAATSADDRAARRRRGARRARRRPARSRWLRRRRPSRRALERPARRPQPAAGPSTSTTTASVRSRVRAKRRACAASSSRRPAACTAPRAGDAVARRGGAASAADAVRGVEGARRGRRLRELADDGFCPSPCATPPSTASRRGCASTSSLNNLVAWAHHDGRDPHAERRHPVAAARSRSRRRARGARAARGARELVARPGLQRRPARRRTTGSANSPRSCSERLAGVRDRVRRGRGSGPAELPRRLLEARVSASGLSLRVDGGARRRRARARIRGDRPDGGRAHMATDSSGSAESSSLLDVGFAGRRSPVGRSALTTAARREGVRSSRMTTRARDRCLGRHRTPGRRLAARAGAARLRRVDGRTPDETVSPGWRRIFRTTVAPSASSPRVEPSAVIHLAGRRARRSHARRRASHLAREPRGQPSSFSRRCTHGQVSRIVVSGSLLEEPTSGRCGVDRAVPYGASRWSSSMYARRFHAHFDTPVAILRPSYAYGPGQEDKLIPHVVLSALRGVVAAARFGRPPHRLRVRGRRGACVHRGTHGPGGIGATIDIGYGAAHARARRRRKVRRSDRTGGPACALRRGRRSPVRAGDPRRHRAGAKRSLGWTPTTSSRRGPTEHARLVYRADDARCSARAQADEIIVARRCPCGSAR